MTLARNAAANFLGAAGPAVLSIVTIPFIVAKLGVADFGVLALVTAIVGYFALLDINVTAGSTKFVAQYNATGDSRRVHQTASFGLAVYGCIGLVGMSGLYLFAQPLVTGIFSVPAERQAVATVAVQVASVGFLAGQIQAYLQSLPGALSRYDLSGQVEASFGMALPLLTVLLLHLGYGLVEVVVLRVVMSLVQSATLVAVLSRLMPGFQFAWPDAALRRALLSFSAFAFLSRIAALTYSNADKLIIGARIGVASLTYYVVPTTLANRVMSLVFRLSGVMLPHASALAAAGRDEDLQRHYLVASRYLFFLNGAISLTLAALAYPLLRLWLNEEFARLGALVMALIALAQWTDSMTNLPSLVNDGLGHPRISGLFALARAALGLALITVGVSRFGIEGAAGGHLVASIVMSGLFLLYVHGRTVPLPLALIVRHAYAMPLMVVVPVGGLAWLLAPLAAGSWLHLLAVCLLLAVAHGLSGWYLILKPEHRLSLVNVWRKRRLKP